MWPTSKLNMFTPRNVNNIKNTQSDIFLELTLIGPGGGLVPNCHVKQLKKGIPCADVIYDGSLTVDWIRDRSCLHKYNHL